MIPSIFSAIGPWHFLGDAGGFSGAKLWRSDGWRLKAWPRSDTSLDQLRQTHAWMRHAAALDIVPRVFGDVIVDGDWLWDCVSWLSGEPLLRDPTPSRLALAGRALGQLHRVWQSYDARVGPSPAVSRRLQLLASCPQASTTNVRELATIVAFLTPSCRDQLTPWLSAPVPLHPCLCDVWTDHVLFVDDRVTGLIDFGSAKIDHPTVDLARLLGSCLGGQPLRWQPLLDAYHAIRPLSPADHALLAVLERTGVVAAGASWLTRLRHRPPTDAERNRIDGIIARCREIEP